MRQDHLVAGADKAGRVVEEYRSFKEGYHDTKLRSEEHGFAFKPLVFEETRGLGVGPWQHLSLWSGDGSLRGGEEVRRNREN